MTRADQGGLKFRNQWPLRGNDYSDRSGMPRPLDRETMTVSNFEVSASPFSQIWHSTHVGMDTLAVQFYWWREINPATNDHIFLGMAITSRLCHELGVGRLSSLLL